MRKLVVALGIITLVATVSVQAQTQRASGIAPPVWQPADIIIQADDGSGFFVFDPLTGNYKCNLCEYNLGLSGTGEVKIDGCNIYFSTLQKGYRIFASVNICDQQAKCAVEIFETAVGFWPAPIREYWSDTNMRDSTAACGRTEK